jgi:hypothetical protein
MEGAMREQSPVMRHDSILFVAVHCIATLVGFAAYSNGRVSGSLSREPASALLTSIV